MRTQGLIFIVLFAVTVSQGGATATMQQQTPSWHNIKTRNKPSLLKKPHEKLTAFSKFVNSNHNKEERPSMIEQEQSTSSVLLKIRGGGGGEGVLEGVDKNGMGIAAMSVILGGTLLLMVLAPETVATLYRFSAKLDPTTTRQLSGVGASHLTTMLTTVLPVLFFADEDPIKAAAFAPIPRLLIMAYLFACPDPTGFIDPTNLVGPYTIVAVCSVGILMRPSTMAVLCAKIMAGVYLLAGIPILLAPKMTGKALANLDLSSPGTEQKLGILLENGKADILSGVVTLLFALGGTDVSTVVIRTCQIWLAAIFYLDVIRKNYKNNLGTAPGTKLMIESGIAATLWYLVRGAAKEVIADTTAV